jgi:hypothetical protein
LGPYQILEQVKNDITCRHLITGAISTLHITRVKTFNGTEEEGYKLALADYEQYVVDRIIAYRGDPSTRTTMEFRILFVDSSIHWVPWSNDLFRSIPYETYCRSHSQLYHLIYTVAEAKRNSPITAVEQGMTVTHHFVDLRRYGTAWFQSLGLEYEDGMIYVVEINTERPFNKDHSCWIIDNSVY